MCTASKFGKLIGIIGILPLMIGAGENNVGNVNFILGGANDVRILKTGQDQWRPAHLYAPVTNGDQVQTQNESRCEIKMIDKSLIRIGENSNFTVTDIKQENQRNTSLSWGKIWMNIKSLAQKETFYVKTPTAVCSIRGTIFRVDSDSTTRIAVYDGKVDVGPKSMLNDQNQAVQQPQTRSLKPVVIPGPHEIPPPFEVSLEQWVQIVKGYQIEIRADGKYAKTKIDTTVDSQLDWVKWNQQRDQMN
ncbi:FecR domain-containing protein [candidate division KSB1 bacterium]|nr:FecR domain-containing protein [candidate division KSB1 bacterium]